LSEVRFGGEAVKCLSVGARPIRGTIKGCPRGLCLAMYYTYNNYASVTHNISVKFCDGGCRGRMRVITVHQYIGVTMPRGKPGSDKIICFYVPEAIKKRIRMKIAEEDTTQQDWIVKIVMGELDKLSDETLPNPADLCCEFLKELAEGKRPTNGKMVKLSHLLNVDVEVLTTIRDRYLDGGEVNVKDSKMSKV